MYFSSLRTSNLLFLLTALNSLHSFSNAASPSDSKGSESEPCTIHSSLTGGFYDIRPLSLKLEGTKSQAATNESYHSRGYDYGANFTINICAPVVEELDDVYGIPRKQWANISAYYKDPKDNEIYSLGQVNNNLTMRGRKLLLNYTGGSPCPDLDEEGYPILDRKYLDVRKILDSEPSKDGSSRASHNGGDSPSSTSNTDIKTLKSSGRYKSTLLSFICDTSPTLSTTPRISFLGTPDHCSYIFEVRSRAACAGATPSHEKGTLGPGGVFTMILIIGVLAYFVGGVVYQRNVMHQRGWRQLPNYSLWAGIFSFVSDMIQIIFGPCLNRLPSTERLFNSSKRGGYMRVGEEDRRNGGVTRGRTHDDENRLIDDLNEEWSD